MRPRCTRFGLASRLERRQKASSYRDALACRDSWADGLARACCSAAVYEASSCEHGARRRDSEHGADGGSLGEREGMRDIAT
jgi:hypothetical protein